MQVFETCSFHQGFEYQQFFFFVFELQFTLSCYSLSCFRRKVKANGSLRRRFNTKKTKSMKFLRLQVECEFVHCILKNGKSWKFSHWVCIGYSIKNLFCVAKILCIIKCKKLSRIGRHLSTSMDLGYTRNLWESCPQCSMTCLVRSIPELELITNHLFWVLQQS